MSIYQWRLKPPINDYDATQPVMRRGTPKPACLPPAGQDSAPDSSRRRKATPANVMVPMSIEWLTSLPKDVRPVVLVIQYPRIANLLALQWSKPTACRAYFDALLVDHRGKRKGFPADVHRDLQTLGDYYYSLQLTLDE
jgi:hypothetical protein